MHDAKGRSLKVGDIVLIPARVIATHGGVDYCNVSVETLRGRRPDKQTELVTGNTGVMYRANPGDENDLGELAAR